MTIDDLRQAVREGRLSLARATRRIRGKPESLGAGRPGPWPASVGRRIAKRATGSPLFDPGDYARTHPGVAESGLDPLTHFATRGLPAGRSAFSATGLARLMHQLDATHEAAAAEFLAGFERAQGRTAEVAGFLGHRRVAIAVHSRANHYMYPIADALRRALAAAGADCVLVDEKASCLVGDVIPIIVAPHEFFEFPLPPAIRANDFIARAVLFNTEQLPSPWFAKAARHLFRARAVLDVNFQTARALGPDFPALHALPGFGRGQMADALAGTNPEHDLFRWAPRDWLGAEDGRPWEGRTFDLFFSGYRTTVRDKVLSRMAADLADRQTFLAYSSPPPYSTVRDDQTRCLFGNNVAVARNTRLILNIGRYPMGYFEWERMVVQGAACGGCVVSTRTLPSPFFRPGEHYFETISRNLDKLVCWLLDDPDGRQAAAAAAAAAAAVVETQLTEERVGRHIAAFLMDLEHS